MLLPEVEMVSTARSEKKLRLGSLRCLPKSLATGAKLCLKNPGGLTGPEPNWQDDVGGACICGYVQYSRV